MKDKHHKILVIGPAWVGDMVMAQSLFMTLKKHDENCQIDVLAPEWSFPLLERMPEVSNAFAMPLTHGQLGLYERFRLGKKIRLTQYDHVIVLPNSWKSALVPFFADIPLRTGYVGEMRWGLLNDTRKLKKDKLAMTVQRFVSLGFPGNHKQPPDYPVPELKIDLDKQLKVEKKFQLNLSNKVIALCPGAEYGAAKRWPAEHYAEVAKKKISEGWSVWLFGSVKDQSVAEKINQLTTYACQNFSGKTSLGEAIDLMSLADVVVTNDSGLMHVAAALNKQLIAIYGSSYSGFTPPLNADAKVVELKLDCSPCFKRECPLGHTKCLVDIRPQQILKYIES
ncbi:MAG: lipopolysaccharide heptosyltransferase II [Methylococcales bacterium]|nr:lipopolysaccharide heptosyltransferase II [Methylococcales bacterium]